jgi:hypothetical protein
MRTPLVEIANANGTTKALLDFNSNASYAYVLSPTSNNNFSRTLDNIASSFERFRIHGLAFEYAPTSILTTVEDGYVFAYINDAAHPLASATTSNAVLLASQSVSFPSFQPWKRAFKPLNDWKYTTASSSWLTYGYAEQRQDTFGAIVAVRTASAGNSNIRGVLYMEVDIELQGLNPIDISTAPALTRRSKQQELLDQKAEQGASESKTRDDPDAPTLVVMEPFRGEGGAKTPLPKEGPAPPRGPPGPSRF